MLSSVHRSQEALRIWGREITGTEKIPIYDTITSYEFWGQLGELVGMLKPIHEAQNMSESRKANLMLVRPLFLL